MTKHRSGNQSSETTEQYKYQEHGPWITTAGKTWCFSCGHVALNNEVSRWATKVGCYFREHPAYKNKMKKAGGRY